MSLESVSLDVLIFCDTLGVRSLIALSSFIFHVFSSCTSTAGGPKTQLRNLCVFKSDCLTALIVLLVSVQRLCVIAVFIVVVFLYAHSDFI